MPLSPADLAAPAAPAAPADVAVLIGRFQPFLQGHLALLRAALALAPQVVLVMGSAHQARTPRSPFTVAERSQMIRQSLPPDWQARVHLLPVRDFLDAPVWVQTVQAGVAALLARLGRAGGRVVRVGRPQDADAAGARRLVGWDFHPVPNAEPADTAAWRDTGFSSPPDAVCAALAPPPGPLPGAPLAAWAAQLPPGTREVLHAWSAGPERAHLAEEWRLLRGYRAAWDGSPYPPVFVTVDSVVRCAGQVLLIRRGQAPGKGLLALPGGFIEQRETTLESALRELEEETHLDLPPDTLRSHLRGQAVFDHPDRSQRGRTITHAYFFDLPGDVCPAIRADDDAAGADWVPESRLPELEDRFLDDHFHVLAHFLGGPAAAALAPR